QAGAQAGEIAIARLERAVIGERVEGGGASGGIALADLAGQTETGELAIAGRCIGGKLGQDRLRLAAIAVTGGAQGGFELRSDGLRLLPFLVLPELPAGDAHDGDHGNRDEDVAVLAPDGRRLLAANLL